MATPFIGEIQLFAFGFAPRGWAWCNGQILSIAQNTALFSLLGTFYGGDGQQTFGLPNLQGRVAIHQGPNNVVGELAGEYTHDLQVSEMPSHTHVLNVAGEAATDSPAGGYFAQPDVNARLGTLYSGTSTAAAGPVIEPTGGNQPHDNVQPTLTMNYSIALQGIFPSRN